MRKLLMVLALILSFLAPKAERFEYEDIQLSFKDSFQIEVILNGESEFYNKGEEKYNLILFEFEKMLQGSYQMPALGVSIDELTKEEKKSGVWLEFKFKGVNYNGDLPFEALLVQVKEDYYGFNVIRKYEGKYDGRCFYINLNDTNMNSLYMYLVNM